MFKDKIDSLKKEFSSRYADGKNSFGKIARQAAILSLMVFSSVCGFVIFLLCGCVFLLTSLVFGVKYRKEIEEVYATTGFTKATC